MVKEMPENLKRMMENNQQLKAKEGPYYERWKAAYEEGMRLWREKGIPGKRRKLRSWLRPIGQGREKR